MRVLIMDMTHGGDILAEEYLRMGHEVVCADVYGIASDDLMRKVAEKGAEAYRYVPDGKYDLKIAPSHCPDSFAEGSEWKRELTFHQAVGHLIKDDRFRIEVTGVKGKTSTCYLLAHILDAAGKKVFLHTSRGQGGFSGGIHTIDRKMSIAPTSLLKLPKGDYDVIIAECSLGGSGKADIAAITNLVEDYGIAGNTRKASDSKASILTGRVNIVPQSEMGIWCRYGPYPLRSYGGRITILGHPEIGSPLRIAVDYMGPYDLSLDPSYLSLQYLKAMDLALEICHEMGIPQDIVLSALSTFKGVPGRGELSVEGDRVTIHERNPGISHISIRRTLECLRRADALNDAIIILDPISRKVCDKMDLNEIRDVASDFGIDMIITAGDGKRPNIPDDRKTVIEFIKEGFQ
jgi:UDP-N-acetylmuramyl pentapeptide synthase